MSAGWLFRNVDIQYFVRTEELGEARAQLEKLDSTAATAHAVRVEAAILDYLGIRDREVLSARIHQRFKMMSSG